MNKKYGLGFTDDEVNFIINVIYPKNIRDPRKYLYQIISNDNGIDVDRFDYLSRDIQMIGLHYGIEFERIMNHSRIESNEIIYSDKVKLNIEDYFRTRFTMYKEVYNHNTVRGIEYMIKELLSMSQDIIPIYETVLHDDWDTFIMLNDSIIDILQFMSLGSDNNIPKIIDRLNRRNIYKCVGEIVSGEELQISSEEEPESDLSPDNIIIDNINISYYGNIECKYYQEKNIHYLEGDIKNPFSKSGRYITKIYYKNDGDRQEAIDVYNATVLLINHLQ